MSTGAEKLEAGPDDGRCDCHMGDGICGFCADAREWPATVVRLVLALEARIDAAPEDARRFRQSLVLAVAVVGEEFERGESGLAGRAIDRLLDEAGRAGAGADCLLRRFKTQPTSAVSLEILAQFDAEMERLRGLSAAIAIILTDPGVTA